MRCRKFQSQIFGGKCKNFRNFQDCFWTVQAEFRSCVLTVRVEFSRLFSDSSDRIFGTIFEQSGTGLRVGFDLGTNVFEFCGMF